MATWKIGGLTIEDRGGQYFGLKDASKAIAMGASYKDVQAMMAREGNPNDPSIKQGQAAKLQTAIDAARGGNIANTLGGQYVGTADTNLYEQVQREQGASQGQISSAIYKQQSANLNPTAAYNPNDPYSSSYARHSNEALHYGQQQWQENQAALAAERDAQRLAQEKAHQDRMFAQAQAEAERQRKEALKVKHGASSSVGRGESARRIRFTTGPGGTGIGGPASLSRSGKGSQLKTLNV